MFFIGVLGWPPKNKTGRNVVKANIVFTILDQTLTLSVSSAVAIHSGTLSLLIGCLVGDVGLQPSPPNRGSERELCWILTDTHVSVIVMLYVHIINRMLPS